MFAAKHMKLNRFGKQHFSLAGQMRKSLFELMNRDDSQNPLFRVATTSPLEPLLKQNPVAVSQSTYQTTELPNGIKVLTSSEAHPSKVNLGLLLSVGTRDETLETSGSLLSIKNTYMKTVLNTNETVNYGMVQMAGGTFSMDYDQEVSYYKAHCLQHDVVDIFNMMADCALEPRSVTAASVGQDKNKGSHNQTTLLNQSEHFSNEILKTAYGLTGLGLPYKGLKSNIDNLNAYTLQKFQLDTINPSKIVIGGSSIQSHQEFVDLVYSKLGSIPAASGSSRVASHYQGGEVRILTDANENKLSLTFEGVNNKSNDFVALKLAQKLFNMRHAGFMICEQSNFTDSGLFGVNGVVDHANTGLEQAIKSLKNLTICSEGELSMAKALLINEVFAAMDRSEDRLEESIKNVNIFGKVRWMEYEGAVLAVTRDQIAKAVSSVLKSKPTVVVIGGGANRMHSYDSIQNMLKL